MSNKFVRIKHLKSNRIVAEGRIGWQITPFESNWYISKKCLKTDGFRVNYLPGLCIYTRYHSRCRFQRVMKLPYLRRNDAGLVILIQVVATKKMVASWLALRELS